METRLLTADDIPLCARIFDESYEALHRSHGSFEEGPAALTWLGPILSHFLSTDPAGGRIAVRDGDAIAFASSVKRDGYWFLSFLFVLPEAQGAGVGRQLLRDLIPARDEATVRATVVESFQPVSTGLYASLGMTPQAIKYWLNGANRLDTLPEPASNLQRESMTQDHLPGLDQLDREALGFTRTADHEWWADAGMSSWIYRRGRDLVAYAYVDDGYIGPPWRPTKRRCAP